MTRRCSRSLEAETRLTLVALKQLSTLAWGYDDSAYEYFTWLFEKVAEGRVFLGVSVNLERIRVTVYSSGRDLLYTPLPAGTTVSEAIALAEQIAKEMST